MSSSGGISRDGIAPGGTSANHLPVTARRTPAATPSPINWPPTPPAAAMPTRATFSPGVVGVPVTSPLASTPMLMFAASVTACAAPCAPALAITVPPPSGRVAMKLATLSGSVRGSRPPTMPPKKPPTVPPNVVGSEARFSASWPSACTSLNISPYVLMPSSGCSFCNFFSFSSRSLTMSSVYQPPPSMIDCATAS